MAGKYRVGKSWTFDYAHKLPFHEGKCRDLHGHTGVLEVELESESVISDGPSRGMVMDFGDMSKIVKPIIEEFLDHRYLNDYWGSPTAEQVAFSIFSMLETSPFPTGVRLVRVRIWETPTAWAEYVST